MKKFAVFILFLIGANYLYMHQELLRKYVWGENSGTSDTASDTSAPTSPLSGTFAPAGPPSPPPSFTQEAKPLPKSLAWKVVSRNGYGAYNIEVALMDGNRWRLEVKEQGKTKIFVAVCDGSTVVANPPMASPANLDPRPVANPVLRSADEAVAAARKMSIPVSELCDGHTCWKSGTTLQGVTGEIWVDSTTGLPVCVQGTANGSHVESHFVPFNFDFTQWGAEIFDTTHTEPLFANYLQ